MKPYGHPKLKGISGCRSSKDSAHRRRCMRVDKKRARKAAEEAAYRWWFDHFGAPLTKEG